MNIQKLASLNAASIASRYSAWVIRWRVPVIVVVLAIVAALAAFAGRVTFDTNYRIWFEENDPYLVAYDRFVREFGSDDAFVVAFKDDNGILQRKPIEALQRLTERIWHVTDVIRVDSITNFQATRATPDGIAIAEMFPAGTPVTEQALRSAADYIDREPLISGALISSDGKVAVIRGRFAPNATQSDLPGKVHAQLTKILDEETAKSGYRFHIAGGPITDAAFNQVAQGDMGRLMPILLLVLVGVLGGMFFSSWGVLIPLGTAGLTIASVMGLNGLLGFKLNAITASSPQLLLGITVAATMHLFATFIERRAAGDTPPEAARHSLEHNFGPIFLTTVPTALGFFSFMVGSIVPVSRLGFIAGTGSLIMMLLAITIVPALLSYCPTRAHRALPQRFHFSRLFAGLGRIAIAHPKRTIVAWLAAAALFAAFTPFLVVDSNPVRYFKPGHWFRDSVDFLQQQGSGASGYEIVVRGTRPETIKTVDYMQDLDRFSQYLRHSAPGDFRNVYSLSSILRSMNRALHGDDPDYYRLPDTDEAIAQYLLLYSLSVPVGMDINDRMNVDNSATRITIVRPVVSTRTSRENIDQIVQWAEHNLKHVKVEFTGRDVLYTNMGNNVTESLIDSLKFDVLTIVPLLFLMFRSFYAGAISVAANVGPLVIIIGLMSATGIMLDVGTLMVASLGLGIAIDDTVHLLAQFYRHRREGAGAAEAVTHTLAEVGTPAAVTTLALMMSFLVFLGADFMPNFYFGILISLVVLLALIADLTLTPAMLYWIYRKREPVRVGAHDAGIGLPVKGASTAD
jgi:predicted RND superfamily exporter protein